MEPGTMASNWKRCLFLLDARWRLCKHKENGGYSIVSGAVHIEANVRMSSDQAPLTLYTYPNPFEPRKILSYKLERSSFVSITLTESWLRGSDASQGKQEQSIGMYVPL